VDPAALGPELDCLIELVQRSAETLEYAFGQPVPDQQLLLQLGFGQHGPRDILERQVPGRHSGEVKLLGQLGDFLRAPFGYSRQVYQLDSPDRSPEHTLLG